jgi:hypothetical protein
LEIRLALQTSVWALWIISAGEKMFPAWNPMAGWLMVLLA